ncbi:MAG TPA: nucleotidyltransferase family protein [Phycisphaerales bacterium]|nr:nucleotidyltransferase family protein [Phycisphaerales bacterium]
MSAREQVLDTLRQLLPALREDLGVRELYLFGSFARAEDTEDSDVNLLVEVADDATLFTLARIKHRLQAALRRPVDLGTCDGLSRAARERIMKERVRVA